MRPVARILPLALVFTLGSALPMGSASGGGATVSIVDNAFQPASIGGTIGTTVTWHNNGNNTHTATSNNGFFNTGDITSGGQDSASFPSAGRYGYRCIHHPGMTGVVKIRMTKSGSAGSGWTIRWSLPPDGSRTFDVRIDRPGPTGFEAFRTNTSRLSASFNPAREGTYKFKARTNRSGASSGFSPVLSVLIS